VARRAQARVLEAYELLTMGRISSSTMSGPRKAPVVVGLGLLGSQAGHLLAYQLRFGAAAQHLQSAGAHSYFPLLAKTALGIVAVALLAGLLLAGLARVLGGRRIETASRPSYIGLLARLFTMQLALFGIQEVVEATVAGVTAGSAADLLLWGTLGQLPIAAAAALALGWLGTRVESAVGAIREAKGAAAVVTLLPAPIAILANAAPDRALLMSRVAGSSLAKRGPPSSSRVTAN
jgi:hypothetical protein